MCRFWSENADLYFILIECSYLYFPVFIYGFIISGKCPLCPWCPVLLITQRNISKQISCDLCNVTGGFQDNGTPTKHRCLESSLIRAIAATNSKKTKKHVVATLKNNKLRILTRNSVWPMSSELWKKWDEGCVPAGLRCKYKPAQGHVWWIECRDLGIIFDNSPFSFLFIFNAVFSLPLIYNEMLKCPLSSVELKWAECSKGLFIVLLWQLFINLDVLGLWGKMLGFKNKSVWRPILNGFSVEVDSVTLPW